MKKLYTLVLLFSMSILAYAQSTCRSAYDTNTNNDYTPTHYFPGPMAVPLNTNINGTIDSGTDIDYYKFFITTSGMIRMTLTNLPANYNLKLVNSLGYTIATSANKGNTNEVISFNVTGGNHYFALVYPSSRRTFNASSCYVLNVSTVTATRMATEDNSSKVNELVSLNIFPNPAREFVNLDVSGLEGAINITLTNLIGEKVYELRSEEKKVRIDLSGFTEGWYILNVFDSNNLIARQKLLVK